MIIIIDDGHLVFYCGVIGNPGIQFIENSGFGHNEIAVRIQGQNGVGISENIVGSIKKVCVLNGIIGLILLYIDNGKIGKA